MRLGFRAEPRKPERHFKGEEARGRTVPERARCHARCEGISSTHGEAMSDGTSLAIASVSFVSCYSPALTHCVPALLSEEGGGEWPACMRPPPPPLSTQIHGSRKQTGGLGSKPPLYILSNQGGELHITTNIRSFERLCPTKCHCHVKFGFWSVVQHIFRDV